MSSLCGPASLCVVWGVRKTTFCIKEKTFCVLANLVFILQAFYFYPTYKIFQNIFPLVLFPRPVNLSSGCFINLNKILDLTNYHHKYANHIYMTRYFPSSVVECVSKHKISVDTLFRLQTLPFKFPVYKCY